MTPEEFMAHLTDVVYMECFRDTWREHVDETAIAIGVTKALNSMSIVTRHPSISGRTLDR